MLQTCPTCGYGGFITEVKHGDFKDADIPQKLRDQGLDAVSKIEDMMSLRAKDDDVMPDAEGNELYNATLWYSADGGKTWKKASREHFPDDKKLAVKIPVPEGTSIDTHEFAVLHMFTETNDDLGTEAGGIETPDVAEQKDAEGNEYLSFYVRGLSPIMVAWKEAAVVDAPGQNNGIGNNGSTNGDTSDDPESNGTDTGDDSNMLVWAILAVISALAAVVTMMQRRKKA